jgi:hypothetical protein
VIPHVVSVTDAKGTTEYYAVRAGNDMIGVGVVRIDVTDRQNAEEFCAVVMDNMAEGLYPRRHLYKRDCFTRRRSWKIRSEATTAASITPPIAVSNRATPSGIEP